MLCALTGIALGGGADLYRSWLRAVHPVRWLSYITDVLFAGVCLLVTLVGLLLADWGSVRMYSLLGVGSGLALYYWLASPLLLPLTTSVLRVERRTRHAAVAAGTKPVRLLGKRSLSGGRYAGRWALAALRRIPWTHIRPRR